MVFAKSQMYFQDAVPHNGFDLCKATGEQAKVTNPMD